MKAKFSPVFSFAIPLVTAWEKYREESKTSVRKQTRRIAKTWKAARVMDGIFDVTTDYRRYNLEFTKKGEVILSITYLFMDEAFEYSTTGKWSFLENDKLALEFESHDQDCVFAIEKLEKREFWLREESGSMAFRF